MSKPCSAAVFLFLHTVWFSYGADSTAILAVPAKIPILLNGKIVGSQAVPAASKITILRKDPSTGKILIKTSLGETWVVAAFIKMMDLEPPPRPQPITSILRRHIVCDSHELKAQIVAAKEGDFVNLTGALVRVFGDPARFPNPVSWTSSVAGEYCYILLVEEFTQQ